MPKEILSKNLKKLLSRKGKSQTDMAKELKLNESTVSSWINSAKYPRRDKIELMADYFGVMPSDITEDKTIQQNTLAAHLEGDFTQEELEEILQYAEFVKQKHRKQ